MNIEAYYRNEKARFVPYGYSKDGVDVKQSQSNVDYTGIRSTVQSDLQVADRALRLTYGLDYDREKDHQWADYYTPSNNGLVYTPTGKKKVRDLIQESRILEHLYKVIMPLRIV